MKKTIYFFLGVVIALSCSQEANMTVNTKVDNNEAITTYYVLQSKIGVPETSTVPLPGMIDLKPYKAQIFVKESEEGFADILVEYAFRGEWTEQILHSFSMSFIAVPYVLDEIGAMLFDVSDYSGTCKTDGLEAESTSVSLKGCLGEANACLFIDGLVNDYPVALKIESATQLEKDYTSAFIENVLVEYTPLFEMSIKNDTDDSIEVSINECAFASEQIFELKPGESNLVRMYIPDYDASAEDVIIEITYGDGRKQVITGFEENSDCFIRDATLDESIWRLGGEPGGAIVPLWLARWFVRIVEP